MTKIHAGLLPLAVAWLCLGASTASAQAAGTPQERAAAAVQRVNGNFIRDNAAQKKTPTGRATAWITPSRASASSTR